jgi:hypothetical protein
MMGKHRDGKVIRINGASTYIGLDLSNLLEDTHLSEWDSALEVIKWD